MVRTCTYPYRQVLTSVAGDVAVVAVVAVVAWVGVVDLLMAGPDVVASLAEAFLRSCC